MKELLLDSILSEVPMRSSSFSKWLHAQKLGRDIAANLSHDDQVCNLHVAMHLQASVQRKFLRQDKDADKDKQDVQKQCQQPAWPEPHPDVEKLRLECIIISKWKER